MDPGLSSLLAPFADPVAAAIVVGGSLVALALRTPARDLVRAGAALRVLARRPHDAGPALAQVDALARIARRHGAHALDRNVLTDPDLAAAVADIVDGAGPEQVERTLAVRAEARIDRHLAAADTWSALAELAPAMGMIGTLVGLVRMFVTMTDPAAIGAAMAVALLTTLYGAVLATLVATPVAGRLRRLARIEASERRRLVAPLVALAVRERPRFHEVAA